MKNLKLKDQAQWRNVTKIFAYSVIHDATPLIKLQRILKLEKKRKLKMID
jgi:hypothetical protein